MNILITGGSGFIGRHLCSKLLQDENNKIWCIDNLQTSSMRNIEEFKNYPNFSFIEMDVIDFNVNARFTYFNEVPMHLIYHLACPASPEYYQGTPIHTLRTCFEGTKNILEFAVEKASKILFTSTSEIYGDPQVHPQPETYNGNVDTTSIRSCYDEGKRVAETLTVEYHRQHKIEVRIARIFNTYGPYLNGADGRVMSNFINQALTNSPITVYGTGKQTRSFCYVEDTVEGLIKLMESPLIELNVNPINIGNNDERTILEIANTIRKMTNSESEITFMKLPEGDPQVRRPDITRAKNTIDWHPQISLEEGLRKTIHFFQTRQAN